MPAPNEYDIAAYLSTHDHLDVYASDHGESVDDFDRRAALVKLRTAINRELDDDDAPVIHDFVINDVHADNVIHDVELYSWGPVPDDD